MKKLFTLFTLMALGSLMAQATDYGLRVAGKSITETGDIDAGQSAGTINWNGNTLTFTNVTVNYTSTSTAFVYYSGTSAITLSFIGNNTISSSQHIIHSKSSAKVTILGERNKTKRLTLSMNSDANESFCPIWVEGDLFIRFLYLDVTGKDYAITGNGSNAIDFGETVLNAKTTTGNNGALCDFEKATFYSYDAYLTTGSFNASKKAVCDKNGNPLSNVKTDASLFVGGVIVGVGYTSTLGIYPDGLNAGSISYSYKTNTLTLDGVDIACSGRFIDNKKLKDLTIAVKGTNTVNNNSNWSIFSARNFTIRGVNESYTTDKLTVSNSFGALCLWPNTNNDSNVLTLKDVTLDLKGSNTGISFSFDSGDNYTGTLTIDKCKVTSEITGSSNLSGIRGFESCTLTDCCVNTSVTPAHYDTELKGFADLSGTLYKKVVIDVPTTTYDGITVLGNSVNNLNASNILVDGQTTGTISYNATAKSITLSDVNVSAPESNSDTFLRTKPSAVSDIYLLGDNNIKTLGTTINSYTNGTVTMSGNGALHARSTKQSGLCMDDGSAFVFDVDAVVELYGNKRGIWGNGYNSSASTVTLKSRPNADYYFRGVESGAIVNVADLILDGMDFYYSSRYGTPGCYFDDRYVRQNGGEVVKGDTYVNFYSIEKDYNITVAGVPVTSCNRNAIGSKYITGGGPMAVTYNSESNTLTLTDATIDYDGTDENFNTLLNNGVDGLTINLVGDNVISTAGYVAFQTPYENKTAFTTLFAGDGKLSAKSSWIAMRIGNYATFDIGEKVGITAEGGSVGIGNNMSGVFSETLIVRENACVKAKGSRSSVERLNDIMLLDDIKLLQPAGAEIMKEYYGWGVGIDGVLTNEWVVFGRDIKGDVNGDGQVGIGDIVAITNVMAGTETDPVIKARANVNGDLEVGIGDIVAITNIMAGAK